jgi:hypothetical protein
MSEDSDYFDDALGELRYLIKRLHRDRGELSTRTIAKRTHGEISHATVAKLLRCETLPSWGVLEPFVKCLGGDIEVFRRQWVAVRNQQEPLLALPAGGLPAGVDEGSSAAVELRTIADADAAEEELAGRAQEQEQHEQSLREQLATAREELADLNDEIAALRRQIDVLEYRAHLDRNTLENLEAKVAALEDERMKLYKQIELLGENLRLSREERIEILEQEVTLARRRTELNFEWARSEEMLKQGLEASLRREAELLAELEQVRADLQSEKKGATDLRNQLTQIQHSHEANRATIDLLNAGRPQQRNWWPPFRRRR